MREVNCSRRALLKTGLKALALLVPAAAGLASKKADAGIVIVRRRRRRF